MQILTEQQGSICNLLERGLYTEELFLKRNAALTAEVKNLKQSIEEAEETCHNKNELDRAKELLLPVTVHILDCYEKMTVEEKNQLWRLLMERITYSRDPRNPGKVEIHLYPKLRQFVDV